jgi:hypothetical protein
MQKLEDSPKMRRNEGNKTPIVFMTWPVDDLMFKQQGYDLV